MLHKPMTWLSQCERDRPIQAGFSLVSRLSWQALHAQDGLLPCEANNSFLASARFARPNRLNSCAVFLIRPL